MTDLVERGRNYAEAVTSINLDPSVREAHVRDQLTWEMADEIERLRAELETAKSRTALAAEALRTVSKWINDDDDTVCVDIDDVDRVVNAVLVEIEKP